MDEFMNKLTAIDIKNYLAAELQKQGASLDDLEEAIKTAESLREMCRNMEKIGFNLASPLTALGQFASAAGWGSLGVGALAGGIGYGAYKLNQDSTDNQIKKMQEAQEYQDALKSLHDAYAQDQLQPG